MYYEGRWTVLGLKGEYRSSCLFIHFLASSSDHQVKKQLVRNSPLRLSTDMAMFCFCFFFWLAHKVVVEPYVKSDEIMYHTVYDTTLQLHSKISIIYGY